MAHNITTRDGMFTVREAAWHGLGAVLPEYPTREEAQDLAHNWEPITEPLFRSVPVITDSGDIETRYERVESHVLNVRSDDGHEIGVVGKDFENVNNSVMYDVASAIEGVDKGSVMFETGGSLKGGAKVWLLLRLSEPIVVNGDPNGTVIPYFALQNSHDGSGAFRGQATMTRIVCDNTAHMADYDAHSRGTEFTFRHTKNIADRIEEAKDALAGWRESVRSFRLISEVLVNTRITSEQQREFVSRFIPMPPPHMVSTRVEANVQEARQTMRNILEGPTSEGIDLTAYGLVQAAIEYQNHYRKARSAETRFKRSYLDRSTITSDAIFLAREIAHV
jgi:phage/plasmid-like protein (TIGR03299 family)